MLKLFALTTASVVLLMCGCSGIHNLRHEEATPRSDVADLDEVIDDRIELYILRDVNPSVTWGSEAESAD